MKSILYIASKNPGKIEEYKKLLSKINCSLLLQPEDIEVLENGVSFAENALKKAQIVSLKTKRYAIADDSGLCVEALNGIPGIYSSRIAENDEERINYILSKLNGIEQRQAYFVANICLCSPKGKVLAKAEAKCCGNILFNKRGINGFGYDPIFEEESTKLTFAEMNQNNKGKISHRGKSVKKLVNFLSC